MHLFFFIFYIIFIFLFSFYPAYLVSVNRNPQRPLISRSLAFSLLIRRPTLRHTSNRLFFNLPLFFSSFHSHVSFANRILRPLPFYYLNYTRDPLPTLLSYTPLLLIYCPTFWKVQHNNWPRRRVIEKIYFFFNLIGCFCRAKYITPLRAILTTLIHVLNYIILYSNFNNYPQSFL